MTDTTAARKVVIDYCRSKYKESPTQTTPALFGLTLTSIYAELISKDGIISSDQARAIASEAWSLIIPLVGDNMADSFSCLAMPEGFDDMSDEDRVVILADRVMALNADKSSSRQRAEILSMGIRIATDALLASARRCSRRDEASWVQLSVTSSLGISSRPYFV